MSADGGRNPDKPPHKIKGLVKRCRSFKEDLLSRIARKSSLGSSRRSGHSGQSPSPGLSSPSPAPSSSSGGEEVLLPHRLRELSLTLSFIESLVAKKCVDLLGGSSSVLLDLAGGLLTELRKNSTSDSSAFQSAISGVKSVLSEFLNNVDLLVFKGNSDESQKSLLFDQLGDSLKKLREAFTRLKVLIESRENSVLTPVNGTPLMTSTPKGPVPGYVNALSTPQSHQERKPPLPPKLKNWHAKSFDMGMLRSGVRWSPSPPASDHSDGTSRLPPLLDKWLEQSAFVNYAESCGSGWTDSSVYAGSSRSGRGGGGDKHRTFSDSNYPKDPRDSSLHLDIPGHGSGSEWGENRSSTAHSLSLGSSLDNLLLVDTPGDVFETPPLPPPPELPKKSGRQFLASPQSQPGSGMRSPSPYDNITEAEANALWQGSTSFAHTHSFMAYSESRNTLVGYSSLFEANGDEKPPLPPKKKTSKIAQYVELLQNFEAQGSIHAGFADLFAEEVSDEFPPQRPPALPPKKSRHFLLRHSVSEDRPLMRTGFEPQAPQVKIKPEVPIKPKRRNSPDSPLPDSPCSSLGFGPEDEKDLFLFDAGPHLTMVTGENPQKLEGPEVKGGDPIVLMVYAASPTLKDQKFREVFLLTYRNFVHRPITLVDRLWRRYLHFNKNHRDRNFVQHSRATLDLFIDVVTSLTPMDLDEEMVGRVLGCVYHLVTSGEISAALRAREGLLEKHTIRCRLLSPKPPLTSLAVTTEGGSLLKWSSTSIAQQMTLLDSDLFRTLEPAELLLWAREQSEEYCPALNNFTDHFNKVSYWARSKVLLCSSSRERNRTMKKLIEVMRKLRDFSNFNSLLAVLAALDSAPIRRLGFSSRLTEALKPHAALTDSSGSFRAYRQALSESKPPCIPYIGLVLQDLTFVHIGNADFLQDGKVNWIKRWQQYVVLEPIRRFRSCNYGFIRNESLLAFLDNFDESLNDDDLWSLSESIKPRGKN